MTLANTPESAPWYKNYMVIVFVIGLPALVVVTCIFFIIWAFKIQDSTVRDDWYMDGKALYQDASKDQLAYDIGAAGLMHFNGDAVSFELNFPADAVKAGTFANGAALTYPATLHASISHATDKARDRDFVLTHQDGNHYTGTVTLDGDSAKYYVQVATPADDDDPADWRLIHAQQLPTSTVALVPLSAFAESQP